MGVGAIGEPWRQVLVVLYRGRNNYLYYNLYYIILGAPYESLGFRIYGNKCSYYFWSDDLFS